MAAKNIRYVAEEQHEEFEESSYATHLDDELDFEIEMSEPRCPACSELLAWHEAPCAVMPESVTELSISASVFAYELGRQVLPMTGAVPRIITWRGQLKERHPRTGMVHRIPVYRLDDGHWDCYREEELQVA